MEEEIVELAKDLLGRARPAASSLFDRVLDSAMDDEDLTADLFRLLDVLPMLATDDEVARHVREYLLTPEAEASPGPGGRVPRGGHEDVLQRRQAVSCGPWLPRWPSGSLSVPPCRRRWRALAALHTAGIAFSADLLGEASVSEAEAGASLQRYAQLIDALSRRDAAWEPRPHIDSTHRGPLPRANVSLKLSSLAPRLDPLDHEGARVSPRGAPASTVPPSAGTGRRAGHRHGAVGPPRHRVGGLRDARHGAGPCRVAALRDRDPGLPCGGSPRRAEAPVAWRSDGGLRLPSAS